MSAGLGSLAGSSRAGHPCCDHCGLPVAPALIEPNAEAQFCCSGCRVVYEAIHGYGLTRYYELKDRDDESVPARFTGSDYRRYDDPAFRELYVSRSSQGLDTTALYLEGMHCAACVWLIEKLPQLVDGVVEIRVEIGRQMARLTWDRERVELSRIARVLDSLGYSSHPYRGTRRERIRRLENRRHLIRIGVAGACAGNVMLIAFALYGAMFSGMQPEFRALFRWASLLLALIALVWPGRVFLTGALSSMRTRVMHMDVPVAVALLVGTLWGATNTIRGVGEIYFESLTAVIFLLLIGRWIQHRQQWSAHDAIELLYRLTPATARQVEADGAVRELPVEALETGDRVELRAGDSVPADGVLVMGSSSFDTSLLTGESRPVSLSEGDRLHAGTVNLSSRVEMKVESTGDDTRVGRLMALVERFARERPPVVQLADRVAHYFVLIVLAWAVAVALLWLWLAPERAVEHAIALLIVTCPCALGLATPLAIVNAIGRAARLGILFKGGQPIELLARPGTMLLDKTGTLTEGRTRLVFWRGADEIKPLVVAVEQQVAHPMAQAFVEAFATADSLRPDRVEQVHGRGVSGDVAGRRVQIGSCPYVSSSVGSLPTWGRQAVEECIDKALSPVLVAVDDRLAGVAGFGDPIVDDARDSIAELEQLGWSIGMISGDHPAVADAVAEQLGIDGRREGAASPERKVEVVRSLVGAGESVVMVGDGVNDAAALSAADVGVAVHGGAEASLAAADVYLRRPGTAPLVTLVRGSRRTLGVIRRNIVVSVLYNLITASLATAGMINPLIAAILMPISSLSVVLLSYRSRTFETEGR
ncbi:MAG: heavy metal translocating P-type ATPase [Acidobacteriota bacterium]|nr:MAG: heavy metal translocating P-type ATPase [Acidobacteriota bacterium]